MEKVVNTKKPGDVYPLRRDRALQPRSSSGEVTAGFRVHFTTEAGTGMTHKVSGVLWEHEARDLADRIAATPGLKLLATPDRPDGIERVRGSNSPLHEKSPQPDTFEFYRRESARYGEMFANSTDTDRKLLVAATFQLRVLSRLAGDVLAERRAECQAIFAEHAQPASS
jgi:hypothetical protein